MNPRYALVATRAGHRCEYCRAPEAIFNFPFEVEHIVPPGHGGDDTERNWALACRSCNLFKSDIVVAIDPESGEGVYLFHPRRDAWESHFRFDLQQGTIVGLTPVGRATVRQLRLNADSQTSARKQWMLLGLLP
jgi:hypothetical protein